MIHGGRLLANVTTLVFLSGVKQAEHTRLSFIIVPSQWIWQESLVERLDSFWKNGNESVGESQAVPAECQGTFANVPNNAWALYYFRNKAISRAPLVYHCNVNLVDWGVSLGVGGWEWGKRLERLWNRFHYFKNTIDFDLLRKVPQFFLKKYTVKG